MRWIDKYLASWRLFRAEYAAVNRFMRGLEGNYTVYAINLRAEEKDRLVFDVYCDNAENRLTQPPPYKIIVIEKDTSCVRELVGKEFEPYAILGRK